MAYCAYCGTEVVDGQPACPRCGKPPSGAPMPQPVTAAPAGATAAKSISIVLILIFVLLAIVAIIGILAAIAVPNLLTAMQRSKQMRTMAEIRSVATAAEAYATDKNHYPNATDMSSLESELVPTYIKTLPRVDGWTHPLKYECWASDGGDKCDNYAIGSGGRDGVFEHQTLRDYKSSGSVGTTNFDNDIVYSNGSFVEWPEGHGN
jgi:type II secretory pathway pseudopilin PulG